MAIGATTSLTFGYVPTSAGAASARAAPVAGGTTRGAQSAAASTAGVAAAAARGGQGAVAKSGGASPASNPHVKFEESSGAAVMKVYDSKSVLIYQVPPKGMLTLVHGQDTKHESRVETSA